MRKSLLTLALTATAATLSSSPAMAEWQSVETVSISKSRQMYNRFDRTFYVNVTITNDTDATLTGPLRLLIDNATRPLVSPDGTTADGTPYVEIEGDIAPGMSHTSPLNFSFARARLTFDALVEQDDNGWQLVWEDNFDGNEIDTTKWSFEENCWGGGNNEQQCYTDRDENSWVANGVLTIKAQRETFTGPDNPNGDISNEATLPYTSARLRTLNKGDWTYGRFEIRAKLPSGQGTWPAIWMLPTDYVFGGWAASGEIDIMEAVNLKTASDSADQPGQPENRTHGTLHYGREWPGNVSSGAAYRLPDGMNPADGFHEYAIEWEEGEIRWYVDDVHFATQTSDGWYSQYKDENGQWVNGDGDAPFNQRFHLLLNLAVGGSWAANTNEGGIDESAFPQTMEVDYVRVYECDVNPSTGQGCATIGDNPEIVEGNEPPEIVDPVDNLGAGPVFNIYIDSLLEGMTFGSYNPEGSISFSSVAVPDRGNVLEVVQTGGVGNLYVNADPAIDMSHWGALGQLVFDLKVTDNPGGADLLVKLDSGWPAVSDARVNLADAGEWMEVRLNVADMMANGNSLSPGNYANLTSIANPFVLEPTGPVTFAVDNIRYEYSLDGVDTAVIYDDSDQPPFSMGKYVANGSVDIEDVLSADASHGTVKQVSFNTNESVVYFQTQVNADLQTTKLDVSGFDAIEFDLFIVEDPRTTRPFMVKMDCGHPCSSGDFAIETPEVGVWTSYQIPLSDLVANPGSTLDLAQVDTPLVIFPAWGNQNGVIMQIDNVRLVGDGDNSNNPPTEVVVDDYFTVFDDTFAEGWSLWDCCANAAVSLVEDADRGTVANVDFYGPAGTVSGLQATLPHDVSALSSGMLEFDLKKTAEANDAEAQWLIKVESQDGSFAQFALNQSLESQDPALGSWQHFSFPISMLTDAGLNPEKLKLILIFPEWQRAQGAAYQLDNVTLTP